MNRTAGLMVLCLGLGAAVMYGGSNFRVRLEPVTAPPQLPPPAEPVRLPESITGASASAPRFDPYVRQAQAFVADSGSVKVSQVTEEVTGAGTTGKAVWKPEASWPPMLVGRKATVEFVDPLVKPVSIKVGPAVSKKFTDLVPADDGVTLASDNKSVVLDFRAKNLAGLKGPVTIAITDDADKSLTSFTLRVPTTLTAGDPRVIVTHHTSSPYDKEPTPVTPGMTVPVFGTVRSGTFLTLRGTKFNVTSDPTVVAQFNDEYMKTLPTAPMGQAQVSGWHLQPQLPAMANTTKVFVAVRVEFNGLEHAYATNTIILAPASPPVVDQLGTPTFTVEKSDAGPGTDLVKEQSSLSKASGKTYFSNTPNLKVTVNAGDTSAKHVLLFIDSAAVPLVQPTTTGAAVFTPTLPPGRDHVLQVSYARGEALSVPMAQAEVRLRTTGPTVPTVSAAAFGSGGGKEQIGVQFSGEDLDIDTLIPASFELKFTTGATGQSANLTTAKTQIAYSPVTKQVTLTYLSKDIVPGEYTLSIKTDVKDVFGNALVGTAVAGTDPVVFKIQAQAGDQLPSQTAGVFQTGPSVALPVYLKPIPLEEGFNPSDRVESRVMRLYYYRDAHRVAQLINRTVKSYNAASVDIRRRAADRSRDDADRSADERKRLENISVRAAQDARAAEAELNNLQNGSTVGRTQAASARIDLGQLEQQLAQARRDLERAQAVAAPVVAVAADTAVINQRSRVDTFVAQSAVLKQQLSDASTELTAANTVKMAADSKAGMDKATTDTKLSEVTETGIKKERAQKDADTANKAADTKANDPMAAQVDKDAAKKTAADKNADLLVKTADKEDADKRYNAAKAVSDQSAAAAATAGTAVRDATAKKNAIQNQIDALDRTITDEKLVLARVEAEARNRGGAGTDPAQQRVKTLEEEIAKRQAIARTGDAVDQNNAARIAAAQQNLAAKREAEARALEAWQVKELEERRLRENQFRKEVAAAKADPDTYGPANLESPDPVLRTSISVIGEGLIQIRGPIKGLNTIRTMVNQIDAPVGQVRISVHTLQVNGERGDRMEKVVANIQRHLDHSRFLTAQSSQMLRYAITAVAARKAVEAESQLPPGCSQWHRDQKYLYAFFGRDFVEELLQIDSEFLRTGNKLLSLNSMNSTSLSAGLFLLALAKNDVRTEILAEFMGLMQGKLPEAEWTFYQEGISDPKCCDACKERKLYLLANNSRFQSFLGFFNAEIAGPDTLNPLQREFLKLAQIFKAQLITELQLKQRVMERSLLEERVGTHYLKELQDAFDLEKAAKAELQQFQAALPVALLESRNTLAKIEEEIARIGDELQTTDELLGTLNRQSVTGLVDQGIPEVGERVEGRTYSATASQEAVIRTKRITLPRWSVVYKNGIEYWSVNFSTSPQSQFQLARLLNFFEQFVYIGDSNRAVFERVQSVLGRVTTGKPEEQTMSWEEIQQLQTDVSLLKTLVDRELNSFQGQFRVLLGHLEDGRLDIAKALAAYSAIKDSGNERLRRGGAFATRLNALFATADPSFTSMSKVEAALQRARDARRPLDEKKLLDLLVDEMEDKYVEILEGTRAHTSNIDNYMKSVTTALDDDFNTQYYLPSFRRARDASRAWDVTLGQIETTTILTNNRSFGKVDPAATMEFDLPKRKILITEGFQAAKALITEYGALVNDPAFLSLAKMSSGNPVSMMSGGGGGVAAVRNVLPGLPGSADETIMAQAGPGRPKEFGSALEALIPDPAIYKFETGTGFEIRPVVSPDGQAVVFNFNYMYTTDVREPVRADEKHLGRVRRHFIHTDVQLGNFELREVSKYMVAIKASRTGRGVQLLQDIPGVGVLFRPLPSAASSLQQNLIYSQATIFPTLFDLMGLRYAPAIVDLDPLADRLSEFAVRNRRIDIEQRLFDTTAARVDESLRTPFGERRMDLYRPQVSLPAEHPNGYYGPGLRLRDGHMIEGYDPRMAYPETRNAPSVSPEGRTKPLNQGAYPPPYTLAPDSVPFGTYPPAAPSGSYPPGGMGAYPRTNPLPPSAASAPGAVRPSAPQPGSTMLPPGYPRPLPPGATGYQPTPPGYGQPGNAPVTREIPATQQPPVVRPAIPPGYPAPRPASLPQMPALAQPGGATPGYSTPSYPSGVTQPAPVPALPPLPVAPTYALPPIGR